MSNEFCYLLSFIIEAITLWMYTEALFIPRRTTRSRIGLLSVLFLCLFLIALIEKPWLNTIFFLSALLLFMLTQYHLPWYMGLFHAVIMTSLNGMTELIFFGIINYYFPHSIIPAINAQIHILLILGSKLLYFSVFLAIIHFLHNRKQVYSGHDKSVFLLFLVPLISLIMMLSFVYYSHVLAKLSELNWLITICASCLLLLNLLVFGINQYSQKKQQEYVQMQLLCQKEADSAEYFRSLVEQHESQRILIHDIRNHLASIDALNTAGEPDKIHAYIEQLQDSGSLSESLRYCENPLLNAILYRYAQQCKTQKISFHTDIRKNTIDFLADADLTALFCNLLDNALRAAATLPDAHIEINAYIKNPSPYTIITIVNSCRENPFTGPGHTLISTKPNQKQHGLGLKSVQHIVDRYGGSMKQYYDLPTLTFHTILTLRSSDASQSSGVI